MDEKPKRNFCKRVGATGFGRCKAKNEHGRCLFFESCPFIPSKCRHYAMGNCMSVKAKRAAGVPL